MSQSFVDMTHYCNSDLIFNLPFQNRLIVKSYFDVEFVIFTKIVHTNPDQTPLLAPDEGAVFGVK